MPRWAQLVSGVAAVAVVIAMFMPCINRGNPHARKTQCLANMKSLALAITMYVEDYNRSPDPWRWSDQLMEYVVNPDVYRCPQDGELRCAYALNDGIGGTTANSLRTPDAARLVTIFESDRGWNAHGGRELLPAAPRHLDGDNFGFLDGHAKWVKRGDASTLMDWHMPPAAPPREGTGK
jgi:hypothetical protein